MNRETEGIAFSNLKMSLKDEGNRRD
jgi:hypothetical protein